MKIHAFVCSWKGHESNALALERKIGRLANVTVINTEEPLRTVHSHWVHLDNTAYFSAQWNKMIELFDADVLFQIQADAYFDDFQALFARSTSLFERYPIGVYEPYVDFTDFQYDRFHLRSLEPQVFEVPLTDCTCWLITSDVLEQLPLVDTSVNKYGWGICGAVAAVSHLKKKLCVRDYNLTVVHPRGRGYPSEIALKERNAYWKTLSPEIRSEMAGVYRKAESLFLAARIRLARAQQAN